MATSAIEDRLLDRLVRWDELRRQGRDVAAEELCSDCPELVSELRVWIEALRGIDRVIDAAETAVLATPQHSGSGGATDRELPDLMRP